MRVTDDAQEDCVLCFAPTALTLHRKQRFVWMCYACQRVAAKPALAQVDDLRRQLGKLGRACQVRKVHVEWMALEGQINAAATADVKSAPTPAPKPEKQTIETDNHE